MLKPTIVLLCDDEGERFEWKASPGSRVKPFTLAAAALNLLALTNELVSLAGSTSSPPVLPASQDVHDILKRRDSEGRVLR